MAHRANYWSCSAFADWLRGTGKPTAETSKGWNAWRAEAKSRHPIRYWIAEEGLDLLQNAIYWPADKLNDIRYYINNRWVTRSHSLTAHPMDIKPGTWQDVGNRFLPCLFNELQDFVEIELAWNYCLWNDEPRKKYGYPWWRRWYRNWRSEESGMAYLSWAKTLTNAEFLDEDKKHEAVPTAQAEAAKEIEILYRWWKYERPARPDPYDASGWSAVCARRREKYPDELLPEDETKAEKKETRKSLDILHKMEQDYEKEDEEMFIRIVKIRHYLWT